MISCRGAAHLSRRSFLLRGGSSLATLSALTARGTPVFAQARAQPEPFSFATLIARAREIAAADHVDPEIVGAPLAALDYDGYRNIQFNEARVRWSGLHAPALLHAYHPGWLFDTTVSLYEVLDGVATPMDFTVEDFNYYGGAANLLADGAALPGVAGFRLNMPMNADNRYDEVVSFLGASYFRALGRDNRYGLSARGLAVNTATSEAEEFPRFTAFWLERPSVGDTSVTFFALLEANPLQAPIGSS